MIPQPTATKATMKARFANQKNCSLIRSTLAEVRRERAACGKNATEAESAMSVPDRYGFALPRSSRRGGR